MNSIHAPGSHLPSFFRKWCLSLLALFAGLFVSQASMAQLRVDISGVGATQYPIAIADFTQDSHGQGISDVIRADLTRSGQFRLISAAGTNLGVDSQVSPDDWNTRGADYLAFGSVTQA